MIKINECEYALRSRDGNIYMGNIWKEIGDSTIGATGEIHYSSFVIDKYKTLQYIGI